MKKILLSILTAVAVLHSISGSAQTATFSTLATTASSPNADTVFGQVQGNGPSVPDFVTASAASGGVTLNWNVIATNFPSDWLTQAALGICDNNQCQYNVNGTTMWNGTGGATYTSLVYQPLKTGQFYLSLDLSNATTVGTYYITVLLTDAAAPHYSKTVTFKVGHYTTGVSTIAKTENDVVLYPNPATSEVNVVYSPDANVKTIAIYNIIGKVVKVYNTLDNSSAQLNIDNIPSGIYFIRMMDGAGHIVATRKFTRQ
ncbi:MAG: T9SS type A sorting domain-containing protein [Flavipsychrobacter sp.]|nr:T9SS type A sorting domain-containing protein [Flavipsychrobacter sp.]